MLTQIHLRERMAGVKPHIEDVLEVKQGLYCLALVRQRGALKTVDASAFRIASSYGVDNLFKLGLAARRRSKVRHGTSPAPEQYRPRPSRLGTSRRDRQPAS